MKMLITTGFADGVCKNKAVYNSQGHVLKEDLTQAASEHCVDEEIDRCKPDHSIRRCPSQT